MLVAPIEATYQLWIVSCGSQMQCWVVILILAKRQPITGSAALHQTVTAEEETIVLQA